MNGKNTYKSSVLLFAICLLLFGQQNSLAQFEAFENLEETSSSGFFQKYVKNFFNQGLAPSPFQVNSNLNIEGRFNNTTGADQIQPPVTYGIYADLNFSIRSINIPFSLSYIGNEIEYTKPGISGEELKQRVKNKYTRIGASPHYKWATLHAGHRNMELSEFTMQNLTFFGLGTELTPGKLQFKYFNGRLANAAPVDVNLFGPQFTVFERNAWGTQLGYGDENNKLAVNLFKGRDKQNSLPIDTTNTISPAQNTAVSISGYKTIKNFRIEGEFGSSSYTGNTFDNSISGKSPFPFSVLGGAENAQTDYNNAYKFGVSYGSNLFSLGVNYKRVEEGYQTMGVAFFNDNIEEYSLTSSTQLFDSRLRLSGNIGWQNDNISELKEQTIKRIIGGLNVGYSIEKWNFNFVYNNNSYSTVYLLNSTLDSLNAKIRTNQLSGNISYTLNTASGITNTFSLNGATSDVIDVSGDLASPTTFYSLDFMYGMRLPSEWNFNLMLGYNNTEDPAAVFERSSVGLGVTKTLFAKIALAAQANFINLAFDQSDIKTKTNAMNGLLSLDYQVSDQHAFYSRFNLISKKAFDVAIPTSVQESIVRIGYKFKFDYTKKENNESK